MVNLVGLVGRKRAGKDTAAATLTACGWERIALADPMRDFMWQLNPLIAPELRWREAIEAHGYDEAKASFAEVRELMQRLGTEAGRQVMGKYVWTDLAVSRIEASSAPVVVTDVRFLNEAAILRGLGALIVRVVRPDLGRNRDMHQSEVEQDEIRADYTIMNNGTPEELGIQLREVITRRSEPRGLPVT